MEPDNGWVKYIRAKYGMPDRFFDCKGKPIDSWAWECMLLNR